MRYLVTGITGFVGPHLANILIAEGHEVSGLVRGSSGREQDIRDIVPEDHFRRMSFFYGDLLRRDQLDEILQKHKFDGVFHLAAQSHPPTSFAAPQYTLDLNTIGTANLADAISRAQPECRLMFCSTSEVYGAVPESAGPIDENFPMQPINPYGVSKAAADMYVRERAASLDRPFFTTRAFSHTGPRRGRGFSISSDAYQLIRIEKGYQEPVVNVGTLSSRRVVMDVRDCVRAYYALMENFVPGEAYNIGGDHVYTMGELLDTMTELTNLTGKVTRRVDPARVRPIDIPVQLCNSSKCRSLTGWAPTVPIEQSLNDLLDYWRDKIR